MELDAFAQRDANLGRAHLREADRQHRLEFELPVVVEQRLIDCGVHAVGQRVVLRMDVPRRDVTGAGPFEWLGLSAKSHERQHQRWCDCLWQRRYEY